ncbi:MAG: SiaB family protein kinase [Flavobacteriales bacterium]
MTTIAGKTLEEIQSIYHQLVLGTLSVSPKETLIFSHFGDFSQNKVDSTIKLIESAIIEAGDKRQTMRRICSVLIEILQNTSLHASKDGNSHMHAYLIISRNINHYRIQTGNLILASDIPVLKARMQELTSMDKNAIRKMFIETLCNEDFTYKGGAGLGLLTIAKRSIETVKYDITSIDPTFGYFQMEIYMDTE